MTFIVTARKWRPQLFDDVVGQQHISTTLKNSIMNDRIGHAYIFAGPRGVGKTTTARILAKRLNCEKPNAGEPCNECSSCQNFLKSQSLDIIEIDGASNRRIDEIRTLRESVKYAPTSGEYKVYIIDEVHMLTTESFNALLKTLEEPPEHTVFIFATTDIHKVPLTIISRCQRFDFRRIELSEIKKLLSKIAKAEDIIIDDDSLTLIARKADGALRDAESIFDQVVSFCGNKVEVSVLRQMLNFIDDEIYFNISEAILSKDFRVAFDISEKIYSNGWNFIDFINGLIEHFRNIITVIITKDANYIEASESYKNKYLQYINKFSEGDLLRILSFLSKTQYELRLSQNQKLKIEISLTHIIGLEKSSTITELLSKSQTFENEDLKKKDNLVSKVKPKQTEIPQIKKESTFKIDLPEPQSIHKKAKVRPNIITDLKEERVEEKLEIEINGDLLSIKDNWNKFKEIITKEKFTVGALLEHSIPMSLKNNILFVDVGHKEDVVIINSSKDFINKFFFSTFKIKLNLKFNYNENSILLNSGSAIDTNTTNDDLYKDHPMVKHIISTLGGRVV